MGVKSAYKQSDNGIIPTEWDDVLLDKVASRGSGHTPDKQHPEYWNGDIKWISLADSPSLDQVYIDETYAQITPAGLANSSAVLHPAGCVVLSRDAGVGKSAIMRTAMAVSQHFMVWKCGAELSNLYLYYWLQLRKPEFERIAAGNTIKTIGLAYFQSLKIPKPSLSEQIAIAEALSDLDKLLAGLERLISKKRDLKRAAMQQLLTGQTRLPGFKGKWEVKRLGDYVRFLKNGVNSRAELSPEGDVRYLHYGDIHVSNEVQLDLRRHSLSALPRGRARSLDLLSPGDVVFVDASEDLVGVGKAVEISDTAGMELVSGLHTIAARFDSAILAKGFKAYLQFIPAFRKHLRRLAAGTKVLATHRGHVASTELELPSPKEQIAIAEVLLDMDSELSALEARRDKTRALKQGMMQELLTGRTRIV